MSQKLGDLKSKISPAHLTKGVIYALILMVGTLVGAMMRSAGTQGYTIFAVVALVNIFAALIVARFLKSDLGINKIEQKAEEEKAQEEDKYMTKADKK